jgi:nitric oxide synthase oxygenase domain/subunit
MLRAVLKKPLLLAWKNRYTEVEAFPRVYLFHMQRVQALNVPHHLVRSVPLAAEWTRKGSLGLSLATDHRA